MADAARLLDDPETRQAWHRFLEALVRRYQASVFNVCYRLVGERREAEERLRPRSRGWVLPPVVDGVRFEPAASE